jgi:hypothetical protein
MKIQVTAPDGTTTDIIVNDAPNCNGLKWKWVRTAINVFLGPH